MQSGNAISSNAEVKLNIQILCDDVIWHFMLDDNFQEMSLLKNLVKNLITYTQIVLEQKPKDILWDSCKNNLLAMLELTINVNTLGHLIDNTQLNLLKADIANDGTMLRQELPLDADRKVFLEILISSYDKHFISLTLIKNLTPHNFILGVNDKIIFDELRNQDDSKSEVRRNDMDEKLIVFLTEYKRTNRLVKYSESKYAYVAMLEAFINTLANDTLTELCVYNVNPFNQYQNAFNTITYAIAQCEVLKLVNPESLSLLSKCKFLMLYTLGKYAYYIHKLNPVESIAIYRAISFDIKKLDIPAIATMFTHSELILQSQSKLDMEYSTTLARYKNSNILPVQVRLMFIKKIASLAPPVMVNDYLTRFVPDTDLLNTLVYSNFPADISQSRNLLLEWLRKFKSPNEFSEEVRRTTILNMLFLTMTYLTKRDSAVDTASVLKAMTECLHSISYSDWHEEEHSNTRFLYFTLNHISMSWRAFNGEDNLILQLSLLDLIVTIMKMLPATLRALKDFVMMNNVITQYQDSALQLLKHYKHDSVKVLNQINAVLIMLDNTDDYVSETVNAGTALDKQSLTCLLTFRYGLYRRSIAEFCNFITYNIFHDSYTSVRIHKLCLDQMKKISPEYPDKNDKIMNTNLSRFYLTHADRLIVNYPDKSSITYITILRQAFLEATQIPLEVLNEIDCGMIERLICEARNIILSYTHYCKEILKEVTPDAPLCLTSLQQEFSRLRADNIPFDQVRYSGIEAYLCVLLEIKNEFKSINKILTEYYHHGQHNLRGKAIILHFIIYTLDLDTPHTLDVKTRLITYRPLLLQTYIEQVKAISTDTNLNTQECIQTCVTAIESLTNLRNDVKTKKLLNQAHVIELMQAILKFVDRIDHPFMTNNLIENLLQEFKANREHLRTAEEANNYFKFGYQIALVINKTCKLTTDKKLLMKQYKDILFLLVDINTPLREPSQVEMYLCIREAYTDLMIGHAHESLPDYKKIYSTLTNLSTYWGIYDLITSECKDTVVQQNYHYIRKLTNLILTLFDEISNDTMSEDAYYLIAEFSLLIRNQFLLIDEMSIDDLIILNKCYRSVMTGQCNYLDFLMNTQNMPVEYLQVNALEFSVTAYFNIPVANRNDDDANILQKIKCLFARLSSDVMIQARALMTGKESAEPAAQHGAHPTTVLFKPAAALVIPSASASLADVFAAFEKYKENISMSETESEINPDDDDVDMEANNSSGDESDFSDEEEDINNIYDNLSVLHDISEMLNSQLTPEIAPASRKII